MKRVLMLPRYDRRGASSRYRSFQFVPRLQGAGLETVVAPLLSNEYLGRIYAEKRGASPSLDAVRAAIWRFGRVVSAHRYDVVIFEKELIPRVPLIAEPLLVAERVPYVVDYDDATYLGYKGGLTQSRGRIGKIAQMAAKVFAGNRQLMEAFRPLNPRTEFIPTVIDLTLYPEVKRHSRSPTVVIGWIGTPITAPYLEQAKAALTLLVRRGLSFELRVIGADPEWTSEISTSAVEWTEDSEVSSLMELDIGIMPLPDTEWARGKCGLKLLQYMACGLPAVASPIGANRDILIDKETGFLADSTEEWADALARLISSHQLRQRLGEAGRERVAQSYSLDRWADVYVRHVLDLI